MKESDSVQSVKRALALIEIISLEKEIGIRELGRRTQLSRGTVQRLISTLEETGFLIQYPASKKYHLSFKMLHIGARAINQHDLRFIARPILERLLSQTRETVVFGILDDGDIVYIDKLTYPQEFYLSSSVGSRVPSYCTASGKAILAHLPKDELMQALKGKELKAYTNKTITNMDDLERDLAATRARGFSIDNEEHFPSVVSIAAPISNYSGKVIAAVGVPGFNHRITAERIPTLGQLVIKIANEISIGLGSDYSPKNPQSSYSVLD